MATFGGCAIWGILGGWASFFTGDYSAGGACCKKIAWRLLIIKNGNATKYTRGIRQCEVAISHPSCQSNKVVTDNGVKMMLLINNGNYDL